MKLSKFTKTAEQRLKHTSSTRETTGGKRPAGLPAVRYRPRIILDSDEDIDITVYDQV